MKLRWNVPKALPHGPVGLGLVAAGTAEMTGAMQGQLISPEMGTAIAILGAANAYSGVALLSRRDDSHVAQLFRAAILFQYGLSATILRLVHHLAFPALDLACGVCIATAIVRMIMVSVDAPALPPFVKALVLTGCIAAMSFTAYPFQIAWMGSDWWTHVVHSTWPNQAAAMATYIYAPTETLMSVIMFCATLFLRKAIGRAELGALTAAIPAVLVGTVVAQEVWYPLTSTQQLVLYQTWTDPVHAVRALTAPLAFLFAG